MEGQVLFDIFDVSGGNQTCLTQPALALAVLALQQVSFALFPTEDFARTSDFETLSNGFSCLCFSRDSRHGTGKLGTPSPLARQKWQVFQGMRSLPSQGRKVDGLNARIFNHEGHEGHECGAARRVIGYSLLEKCQNKWFCPNSCKFVSFVVFKNLQPITFNE